MGLFGSDTHHQRVTYGEAETEALQPGMFDAWRRIMGSRGLPYAGPLNDAINRAYSSARMDMAGSGYGPDVTADIQADMARRGGIESGLMRGMAGMQGQENVLNATGQQAGYLGALTSQRPQYSMVPDDLSKYGPMVSNAGSMMLMANAARPDAFTPTADMGTLGAGSSYADPFAGARTFTRF